MGERTGTRGGDDVGRGREVVKGATVEAAVVGKGREVVKGAPVEAAVVDGGYGAVVEEAKLELDDDAGATVEVGVAGVDADELKMSTASE